MIDVRPPYASEVPNTVDSMLKNTTEYTEAQAARRGKFSITGESVKITDVGCHEVVANWEERNDNKATAVLRDRDRNHSGK